MHKIVLFALLSCNILLPYPTPWLCRLDKQLILKIISFVKEVTWHDSARTLLGLSKLERRWRLIISDPDVYLQILAQVAQQCDDESKNIIRIAQCCPNMPAYKDPVVTAWLAKLKFPIENNTKLLSAVEDNNLNQITSLLANGICSINAVDSRDRTAVFYAARYGKAEALERLLAYDPDVNSADKCQETPLKRAAKNGHGELVRLLLAAQADPNRCDIEGYSPLMNAAHEGHLQIVQQLINAGANLNFQAYSSRDTALISAAGVRNYKIVSILLNAGADITLANRYGQTVLDILKVSSREELIDKLKLKLW